MSAGSSWSVLLVRHAWAGDRARWSGPDHERPLDRRGREQAQLLGHDLDALLPAQVQLVSSPARRCLATLEPLARRRGQPIVEDVRLAESTAAVHATDRWPDAAWCAGRALAALDEHHAPGQATVVCSHGEVLPALLGALAGRLDLDLRAGPDLTAKAMPKAGAWWLHDRTVTEVAAPDR